MVELQIHIQKYKIIYLFYFIHLYLLYIISLFSLCAFIII